MIKRLLNFFKQDSLTEPSASQELTTANRRKFVKYGMSAGGAALLTSQVANATHLENIENPDQFIVEDGDPSPPVVEWQETFPDYLFRPKATVGLNPPP